MTEVTEKQSSRSARFQAWRSSTESPAGTPTPSFLRTREFLHRIVEEAASSICLSTRNGSHSAAPWAFIRRYNGQEGTPAGHNHLIYTSYSCLLRSEPWETLTEVPNWRDALLQPKMGLLMLKRNHFSTLQYTWPSSGCWMIDETMNLLC